MEARIKRFTGFGLANQWPTMITLRPFCDGLAATVSVSSRGDHAQMAAAVDGVEIDVRRFARDGRRLALAIPVASMARVASLTTDADGAIDATVTGSVEDGDAFIDVATSGQLSLLCSRCLSPLRFELKTATRFRAVSGAQAVELSDDLEWTVDDIDDEVDADQPLRVQELVEDEVLLGLPMAVVHDECTAVSAVPHESSDAVESSPFAVLKALRRVN